MGMKMKKKVNDKITGIAGKLTLGVIVFGLLLGVVCSAVG